LYFDPKPKRRREDLYGRERELAELEKSVKSNPLTVVTGVRRLGKTSLILVALSERPGVVVDLRGVGRSWESLYRRINAAINDFARTNSTLWSKMKKSLKAISGVSVMGTGVTLSWGADRPDLATLLERFAEHDVVVAFDEVQTIRGVMGRKFAEVLAHLYDHTDLKTILSGSEVGLLYDFLGVEDPKAPLYGRYFHEVKLGRFSHLESVDFLTKGFEQVKMDVQREVLEYAVERLDGVVGWLVNFGWKSVQTGEVTTRTVDEVLEDAEKLALSEFKSFLEKHVPAERRLAEVARAIASGKTHWSDVKRALEKSEKREVPDATLSRLLNTLLKATYVEKIVDGRNVYYRITDPVLEHALRRENAHV
jgi:hypothetical protein